MKKVNWLDVAVSFYKNHHDKVGVPLTFRQILFNKFNDYLPTIIQLKSLDRNDPDYEIKKRSLKKLLGCYALNLIAGRTKVLLYSGLLQIDIDNITDFDIDELKQAVFALPFICFVGVSCSGNGLYAFAKIDEPLRLKEYAQQIFDAFDYYNIQVDVSKGKNFNDLRYVSYDANMLYREDPQPLKIKSFNTRKTISNPVHFIKSDSGLMKWAIKEIQSAQVGQRFETVRKVAFTLGGVGIGLDEIKIAILNSLQYSSEQKDFINVANECFSAGQLKPLAHA
jgi:hypothetical protein